MSGGLLYVEVAPYWNVNSSAEIVDMRVAAVEVAPYWNVNIIAVQTRKRKYSVEVAPYWNVNKYIIIGYN